jgi:pimeloyl-ACP methyl ester carboxylesterase
VAATVALGIIRRQEMTMNTSFLAMLASLVWLTAFWPGAAQAQDSKACAVVMVHGKGAAAQSLAALARRLQGVCTVRSPEFTWSDRRPAARDAPLPQQVIARQVKDLRLQGFKRIVLLGQGTGANAALAFGGTSGDTEGVVALGGDLAANAEGWGDLPTLASQLKQHVPLLWIIGSGDPLLARGEDFAFSKAPPHPGSRYLALKAEPAALQEAAAKPVLDWLRELQ